MSKQIKAVEKYQCPGCVIGSDMNCGKFKPAQVGLGCGSHAAGTRIFPTIGLILLGMPKGFTRCGPQDLLPEIYGKVTDYTYDFLNVPTWKWRNKKGHAFVRGHNPRTNRTFLHVFLSSDFGYDDIKCHELTEKELAKIDA